MPLAFSYISMALAAAAFLLCIPIAVGVLPFDLYEAKTEIASGSLIEYSGPYLALMKVAKTVLAFAMSFLAATLFFNIYTLSSYHFLGPVSNLAANLLVALLIMFLTITLPRTIFARVKPRQALKFYWSIPILLVILATVFNILGM